MYCVLLGDRVLVPRQQADGVTELHADLGLAGDALGPSVGLRIGLDWRLLSAVMHAVIHAVIQRLQREGRNGGTRSVVGQSAPATLLEIVVWTLGFGLAVWENCLVMSFDATLAAAAPTEALAGVVGGLVTLLGQAHNLLAGPREAHDVGGTARGTMSGLTVLAGPIALLRTL